MDHVQNPHLPLQSLSSAATFQQHPLASQLDHQYTSANFRSDGISHVPHFDNQAQAYLPPQQVWQSPIQVLREQLPQPRGDEGEEEEEEEQQQQQQQQQFSFHVGHNAAPRKDIGGQFGGIKAVPNPPDLQTWRQRLFNVSEMIALTEDEFQTYFPHVDNIYSHRSTQRYKSKPFISQYWDCRLKGRPSGTPKSDDPSKKKRRRTARQRDLCNVKIKITEHLPGATITTVAGNGTGETDFGCAVESMDLMDHTHRPAAQAFGVLAPGPILPTFPPGHPGIGGARYYTIQRVSGGSPAGEGDPNGGHRHTLAESDAIKKNSITRKLLKEEKEHKRAESRLTATKSTGTTDTNDTTTNVPCLHSNDRQNSQYNNLDRSHPNPQYRPQPGSRHLTRCTGQAALTALRHSSKPVMPLPCRHPNQNHHHHHHHDSSNADDNDNDNDEDDLQFINRPFCPFAQRIWIALELKQLPYHYIEIEADDTDDNSDDDDDQNENENENENGPVTENSKRRQAPPPLRQRQRQQQRQRQRTLLYADQEDESERRGPTRRRRKKRDLRKARLHIGDCWEVCGSRVILEYLDDIGVGPLLLPPLNDARSRAHCRMWADHIDRKVIPAFNQLLKKRRNNDGDNNTSEDRISGGEATASITALQEALTDLVQASDGTGPFFLGSDMCVVDIVLAPWMVPVRRGHGHGQSWHGRRHRWSLDRNSDLDLDSGFAWEDAQVKARWDRWADSVQGSEAVRRTMCDG